MKPNSPSKNFDLRSTKPRLSGELIYILVLALIVMHSLAAYALFKVPFQWIVQAGFILLFAFVGIQDRLYDVKGVFFFWLFFVWALFVTFFNVLVVDYSRFLPPGATTGYPIFISLRLLSFVFFATVIGLVTWLIRRGYGVRLMESIGWIGFWVSVFAIYIYVAQKFGLPEPPRSRMGTSGDAQKTVFSYAFHRAMGTFREPSHLAEWLVVPFLFSLMSEARKFNLRAFVIGSVILLSGSLTGMMGICIGLFASTLLTLGNGKIAIKAIGKLAIPLALGLMVFSVIASSSGGDTKGVLEVVWDRIEPILESGAQSSNRNYVYNYVDKAIWPVFGQGLGNSNLVFTYWMGTNVPNSFLNLFINVLFSLGYVGIILLGLFFLFPVIVQFVRNGFNANGRIFGLFSAFFAWIVMYSVHSEEFSMMFAIVYPLLLDAIFRYENQTANPLAAKSTLAS